MKNALNPVAGLVLGTLLLCIGGSAFAGTTGKIAGTVKGSDQTPIPGANVMLAGTTLGGVTDVDGGFILLNIPPGVYAMRVAMIGYKQTLVEAVRVRNDLTTTVNVTLSPTVLESGETVTVVAERQLIQKDMTGSIAAVGGDEIAKLPVQDIAQVIQLQAGVVESGGLHIRGGRAGEVAYWVDGVATTDVFSGGMGLDVENAAVSELQVISGTFNAEYGQAMSGIVNILTKEGGKEYEGQFKAYAGDYFSNDPLFSVLKSVRPGVDPVSGTRLSVGEFENPLKQFNPVLDAELTAGGPVPIFKDKLSFFVNGRYFSDEGYLYCRRWFEPYGAVGDSALVPMNPYTRKSGQAKLTFRATPKLKLMYNAFYSDFNQDRSFQHDFRYNPGGVPKQFGMSTSHIFSVNHVLSPSTFYELKINRFFRDYHSYVYEITDPNSIPTPKFLVHVPEDTVLGIVEETFDYTTSEGEAELQRLRALQAVFHFVTDPSGPPGYVDPDSSLQPTGYSYLRAGQDLGHYFRSTGYWVGKFDLTSQVNKVHQIKAGAELRLHELEFDAFTLQSKLKEGKAEEIVPFVPWKPPVSNRYHDY